MITNDVQYRTAKAQVDRLQRLREELDERPLDTNDGELRRKLETHAVESQVSELRAELDDYDALRSGDAPVGHLTTLDDLPRLLVRHGSPPAPARRPSQNGWVSRSSRSSGTSPVTTLQPACPDSVRSRRPSTSLFLCRTRCRPVMRSSTAPGPGLNQDFVRKRIAPAALREARRGDGELAPIIDLASRVGRVFGMDASSVLAGTQIEPDNRVLAAANFKIPKGATTERVAA